MVANSAGCRQLNDHWTGNRLNIRYLEMGTERNIKLWIIFSGIKSTKEIRLAFPFHSPLTRFCNAPNKLQKLMHKSKSGCLQLASNHSQSPSCYREQQKAPSSSSFKITTGRRGRLMNSTSFQRHNQPPPLEVQSHNNLRSIWQPYYVVCQPKQQPVPMNKLFASEPTTHPSN